MNKKNEPSEEMAKVLGLLAGGKTEGVSKLLNEVRSLSAMQAWMLASYFDDGLQNPFQLKISRRKKGAPPNPEESPHQRAYRLGRQVAKERKLKEADVETSLTKAINKVIKDWSPTDGAKVSSASTLKRDFYYFEKVEVLRAKLKSKFLFPPWPPLGNG